uniref:Uncharacterized protein n=1 Tax=Naja naja TaxID=35670 RepID=A0A8C6VNG1_NAJNA
FPYLLEPMPAKEKQSCRLCELCSRVIIGDREWRGKACGVGGGETSPTFVPQVKWPLQDRLPSASLSKQLLAKLGDWLQQPCCK